MLGQTHRLSLKYIYLFLLMLHALTGYTKSPSFRFQHFDVTDGLSQHSVMKIVQDEYGLMWFATEDGLNRFDGKNILKINRINSGVDSFDNRLRQIKTKAHFLYLAGSKSIHRLHLRTGLLEQICSFTDKTAPKLRFIRDFEIDMKGRIWVIAAGMNPIVVDSVKHSTNRMETLSLEPRNRDLLFVCETTQGDIVLGGRGNELTLADSQGTSVRHVKVRDAGQAIHCAVIDPSGTLWLGTTNGLLKLNQDFETVDFVSMPRGIVSLCYDRNGIIWGSFSGSGVFKYELRSKSLDIIEPNQANPFSIKDDEIRSTLIDQEGNLWVGYSRSGLSVSSIFQDNFVNFPTSNSRQVSTGPNPVNTIIEKDNGNLLIGSRKGLLEFEIEEGTFSSVELTPQSSTPHTSLVYYLFKEANGDIWGSGRAPKLFKMSQNQVTTSFPNLETQNAFVLFLIEDEDKNLYAGTTQGIFSYRRDIGDFIPLDDARGKLSDPTVNCMLFDHQNNLLVGTEHGLNRYDSKTHQVTKLPLARSDGQDRVLTLFEPEPGQLWIGTHGDGLLIWEMGSITHQFSTKNGMLSDTVHSIYALKGNLFIVSTHHGLATINMDNRFIRNYGQSDGLINLEYNLNAHVKTQNGDLYFGGILGLDRVNPHAFSVNPFKPPTIIQGVTPITNPTPPPWAILNGETFNIPYQEKSVTIQVAALSYAQPGKNQFAYHIESLNAGWQQIGEQNRFTLHDLPPGLHPVSVRASNSDGIWNEEGSLIWIQIQSPFWKQVWFIAFCVVLLIALLVVTLVKGASKQSKKLQNKSDLTKWASGKGLSPRECEVLVLLLQGGTNKKIGEMLFISEGTVRNHVYSIYKKLNIKNRMQLSRLFSSFSEPH